MEVLPGHHYQVFIYPGISLLGSSSLLNRNLVKILQLFMTFLGLRVFLSPHWPIRVTDDVSMKFFLHKDAETALRFFLFWVDAVEKGPLSDFLP